MIRLRSTDQPGRRKFRLSAITGGGFFLLTFCVLLLFPLSASAVDTLALPPKSCPVLEAEIRTGIDALGSCWNDDECVLHDFGCPWQLAPCHYSIVSRKEEEKAVDFKEKMKIFRKRCISADALLKKRCAAYDAAMKTAECKVEMKLVCLNGRCSNLSAVLLQNQDTGTDPEGSRAVLGE